MKKIDYKQKAQKLRDILNEWDFIGVYPFKDEPKNEYDCLIDPIISRLNANITKEDLKKYLIKELDEHFGITNPRFEKIDNVVEKIIDCGE